MRTLVLTICLIPYFLSVSGLVLHSCFFIPLFLYYQKYKNTAIRPETRFANENLPFQIIQLPVYNENLNLVMQLVISATKLSYPKDRLLIQLLDDSDKEEISIQLKKFVSKVKKKQPELPLFYLHRKDRKDFKAGNLNYGLKIAKEHIRQFSIYDTDKIIVSIFDADFIIPSNYLKDTVHYFTMPDVGVVQATLDYYNYNTNYLTRAQASFLINLHLIEFGTRSRAGHLTIYRGSAGSWRLSAIEDSGGWRGETHIEDVDLSIAAQLYGWRILYLKHVSALCQLPRSYNEFKLQQRSWVKGLMEVFRKNGGAILRSKKLSLGQKILALDFYIILTLQPLFMVAGHLFLIPSYYCLKEQNFSEIMGWITLGLFLLLSLTHLSFLSTGLRNIPDNANQGKCNISGFLIDRFYSVTLIPSLFVALTYGLIEGIIGVRVHRDRTNKVDPSGIGERPELSSTQQRILFRITLLETLMSIYSILFVCWAVWENELIIAFIYGILAICYSWNTFLSFAKIKKHNKIGSSNCCQ